MTTLKSKYVRCTSLCTSVKKLDKGVVLTEELVQVKTVGAEFPVLGV